MGCGICDCGQCIVGCVMFVAPCVMLVCGVSSIENTFYLCQVSCVHVFFFECTCVFVNARVCLCMHVFVCAQTLSHSQARFTGRDPFTRGSDALVRPATAIR